MPTGTYAELRAFLRSLISDANDALSHLADDRYDLAREDLRCLDVDAANIVQGVERLAAEYPPCPCGDVCEGCERLDAGDWQ